MPTAILFLVADLVADRRGNDSLPTSLPPIAQHGLIAALFFGGAIAMAGMPPLSGFIGKLLVLDAIRGPQMALVWTAILVTSLVTIIGFSRAGSRAVLERLTPAHPGNAPRHKPEPLAFAVVFALLAGLAALTVFGGPVTA